MEVYTLSVAEQCPHLCCTCVAAGIAAGLLLGGASAVGTDTDPLAVRAAEANAALNGVEGRFTVLKCGANLTDPDPLLSVCQTLQRSW